MLDALFWGLVGAGGLLVGAVAAMRIQVQARYVGAAIVVTAGAVICSFGFDLDEKAYELGGGAAATLGVIGGALALYVAARMLDRPAPGAGVSALLLPALPASVVIAITVVEDGDVGGAIMLTVFLWNIAYGAWVVTGLHDAGRLSSEVLRPFSIAVIVSGLAAGLAYAALESAPDGVVATAHAAGIGATLCAVVDAMVPIAIAAQVRAVGALALLGFGTGFGLSII